jgi:hypothetical protein
MVRQVVVDRAWSHGPRPSEGERRERVRVVERGDLGDHPADADACQVRRSVVELAGQRRSVGCKIAQRVRRSLWIDGGRRAGIAQVVPHDVSPGTGECRAERVGPREHGRTTRKEDERSRRVAEVLDPEHDAVHLDRRHHAFAVAMTPPDVRVQRTVRHMSTSRAASPKSWSLVAAMHPDVAAAYDAAQDRGPTEIIDWLASHAMTRVGPRGRQVQISVEKIDGAVVRHYTSRAGDLHLHLQINARVFADGSWRGLHSVGVVDSIEALNGIGHAAVRCDPEFRAAFAAHGYALAEDGDVRELAPYVGAFSRRASQIARNVDRYEAAWRAEHPGEEPGPKLRRSWDRRAWAEARPDKVVPKDGAALVARWNDELRDLGFTPPVLRTHPYAAAHCARLAPPRRRPTMDPVPRCGPALHHRRRGASLPGIGHDASDRGAFRCLSGGRFRRT